jgi:phage shock protein PspC (stress-responsive transcriptional regulator)
MELEESPRRIYRPHYNRVFLGVCAGIAEYFGIDPTVVRLITAIAAIGSFGGVAIAYLIAAVIIPAR